MLISLALSRIPLILDLLIKDLCQLEKMKAISFSLSTLALSSIPLMLRSDQEVVFAPSAATWEEWRSSAPPSERMRLSPQEKSHHTSFASSRETSFPFKIRRLFRFYFSSLKNSNIFMYIYITKPPNLECKKGLKSSPKLSIPLLFDWQSRSQWC